MAYTRITAAISLAALALSACTARFIDDFEADTAGAPPLVAPAGAPNDQVFILDGTGAIRVSNSAPIAGAQSLNIGGPGSSGAGAPNLFMYAEPLSDPSQRVYAHWTGRMSDGAGARIFFWTGHFSTMVAIVLENGQIIVDGNQVGTYTPGQEHTIFVNADPATDQYQVTATGAVSAGINAIGTVDNPAFFPQGNIGLTMQLIRGGHAHSYKIDTVRMSERNPPASS